ncbi:response regulator transcription factor [Anaerotardibacter muris]|uniref:response regulator transcription factor n=1 Tax=Anaerotardibacter muris TaxID=2941505 RepID=UPI002041375C|nr:response regulator transcription factor [Anaerotardibacter muris]
MTQLLLVEDDRRLSDALAEILREHGYEVDTVNNGKDGLDYAASGVYDVVILDVMLPLMDGFHVVSELRRKKISTPVLLLTAKDAVPDKVQGYDSGADDYMTKPFSPTELLAHLRALTRRKGEVMFEVLDFADISLNLESNDLSCRGETIRLRMKEFLILKILMENAGRIISKETLLERAWGIDSDADANNVEAHISFLRKKLRFLDAHAQIETVPKLGYRLIAVEADDGDAATPDQSAAKEGADE